MDQYQVCRINSYSCVMSFNLSSPNILYALWLNGALIEAYWGNLISQVGHGKPLLGYIYQASYYIGSILLSVPSIVRNRMARRWEIEILKQE